MENERIRFFACCRGDFTRGFFLPFFGVSGLSFPPGPDAGQLATLEPSPSGCLTADSVFVSISVFDFKSGMRVDSGTGSIFGSLEEDRVARYASREATSMTMVSFFPRRIFRDLIFLLRTQEFRVLRLSPKALTTSEIVICDWSDIIFAVLMMKRGGTRARSPAPQFLRVYGEMATTTPHHCDVVLLNPACMSPCTGLPTTSFPENGSPVDASG